MVAGYFLFCFHRARTSSPTVYSDGDKEVLEEPGGGAPDVRGGAGDDWSPSCPGPLLNRLKIFF